MPNKKQMPEGLTRHQKAVWFLANVPGPVAAKMSYLQDNKGYTTTETLEALNSASNGALLDLPWLKEAV